MHFPRNFFHPTGSLFCFRYSKIRKKSLFLHTGINPQKGDTKNNIRFYEPLPETEKERITETLAHFNAMRKDTTGQYAISIATPYRRYYALWRIFKDGKAPLFIRTLADTAAVALGKAMEMLKHCTVSLEWKDNEFFTPYYEQTYDTLSFGKYQGKRIAEVYYIDPGYVLWLANKFEPEKKKLLKIKATACSFAAIHAELSPPRRATYYSPSQFVGTKGEKLPRMTLKVLYVKQQVDTYKPDFYIDQRVIAADRLGNRFTFTEKAAGRSQTPKALSCFSRAFLPGMEITLESAKVMGHYESRGVKYTRLGYLKLG